MRSLIAIPCDGAELGATLDEAPGEVGLLIVSGGAQIRIGAHRGMARLAAACAAAGYPVLRFDRRGIGDSEGEDPGFRGSAVDLAAAAAALRERCPAVRTVVGFGLCDGASGLALHHRVGGIDALVLANPWLVEPAQALPPPAAIRQRYAERLRSPREWWRLLTGGVSYSKLIRGIVSLLRGRPRGLAGEVAAALGRSGAPLTLIIAERDATAIAFLDEWRRPSFGPVRSRARIETLVSASHSFAAPGEPEWLAERVIGALTACSA